MRIATEPTGTDAASVRAGRLATWIVTSSMLVLVLLQVLATNWTISAGGRSASDQQPSAAVVTLLRSI